jgi:hypothetical protein
MTTPPSLLHLVTSLPLVDGNGKITKPWLQMFTNLVNLINKGVPYPKLVNSNNIQVPASITLTLAKLTTGGTAGSITITNGIITGYVAST